MIQLILHLIGDYVTQSDWMANNKTKRFAPAAAHAIVYTIPFVFLTSSYTALAVILWTHFLIDRHRLARFVVYAKNVILQPGPEHDPNRGPHFRDDHNAKWSWSNCSGTGYPSETPAFLAVWLLIAADNTLHLAINYLALTYL